MLESSKASLEAGGVGSRRRFGGGRSWPNGGGGHKSLYGGTIYRVSLCASRGARRGGGGLRGGGGGRGSCAGVTAFLCGGGAGGRSSLACGGAWGAGGETTGGGWVLKAEASEVLSNLSPEPRKISSQVHHQG